MVELAFDPLLPYQVLHVAMETLIQTASLVALWRLLPMRHPKAFFALGLAIFVVLICFPGIKQYPIPHAVLSVSLCVLMPLWAYEGKISARILALSLALGLLMLGEVVCGSVWIAVTGYSNSGLESVIAYPMVYVVSRVLRGQLILRVENPVGDYSGACGADGDELGCDHGWGTGIVSRIVTAHGGSYSHGFQDGRYVARVLVSLD